jgi:hypothetical protein
MLITIPTYTADNPLPIYWLYPLQENPQPAYIQLTDEGVFEAIYDPELPGEVPPDVWEGRTLQWRVPSNLTFEDLNAILKELAPLAEAVYAGTNHDWDGNNYADRLSKDAHQAAAEIGAYVKQLNANADRYGMTVLSPQEYVYDTSLLPITHDSTAKQVAAVAAELFEAAWSQGIYVPCIEGFVALYRDELKQIERERKKAEKKARGSY